jgi:hypothetical protein
MHFQIMMKERPTKCIFKVNCIFRISILLLHVLTLQECHLLGAQRILMKLCMCCVIICTPITQNTAWVAYKALNPLRMSTICRNMSGLNLEHSNNKRSTISMSICWSSCKRYYKMLGSTIKREIMVLVLLNCNIWLAGPCRCTFQQYSAWPLKSNTCFINHMDDRLLELEL